MANFIPTVQPQQRIVQCQGNGKFDPIDENNYLFIRDVELPVGYSAMNLTYVDKIYQNYVLLGVEIPRKYIAEYCNLGLDEDDYDLLYYQNSFLMRHGTLRESLINYGYSSQVTNNFLLNNIGFFGGIKGSLQAYLIQPDPEFCKDGIEAYTNKNFNETFNFTGLSSDIIIKSNSYDMPTSDYEYGFAHFLKTDGVYRKTMVDFTDLNQVSRELYTFQKTDDSLYTALQKDVIQNQPIAFSSEKIKLKPKSNIYIYFVLQVTEYDVTGTPVTNVTDLSDAHDTLKESLQKLGNSLFGKWGIGVKRITKWKNDQSLMTSVSVPFSAVLITSNTTGVYVFPVFNVKKFKIIYDVNFNKNGLACSIQIQNTHQVFTTRTSYSDPVTYTNVYNPINYQPVYATINCSTQQVSTPPYIISGKLTLLI